MKKIIITLILVVIIAVGGYFIFEKSFTFSNGPQATLTNLPGFTSTPSMTASALLSPTPTTSLVPTNTANPTGVVLIPNVPFTPQAPSGQWSDPRQESGCEEATALIAMYWVQGKQLTPQEALQQIVDVSDYETKTYGDFYDTSVQDTIDRIFKGYFKYNNVEAKYNITADDITAQLAKGNLVLVPTNGRKLNNPFYTAPGPLQHMLVIKGYDSNTDEFITNDPGTKRGESYRYPVATVMDAIYDYPTGNNEPVMQIIKAMIIVRPQ